MKALVLQGPERLEMETLPDPRPGRGEVLVKVKYCGICGSDLHAYQVGQPPGMVLGHEFTGEVLEPGPGVAGWNPGRRVAVIPGLQCDACPSCRQGLYNLCDRSRFGGLGLTAQGALAELICVRQDMLRELPDEVDYLTGTLAEPLAVSLHALYRGGFRLGERVLITGAGPIGALCLKLAIAGGASETWVIEGVPQRQEIALRSGASHVLPPGRESLRRIRRFTDPGVDLALECSGVPEALDLAMKSVRPMGRVVVAGIHQEPVPLEFNRVAVKELQISGSFGFLSEMETALNLISRDTAGFRSLVSGVVSMEEAPTAFREILHERKGLKTVVRIE